VSWQARSLAHLPRDNFADNSSSRQLSGVAYSADGKCNGRECDAVRSGVISRQRNRRARRLPKNNEGGGKRLPTPRVADELGLRVERAVVAAGNPHRDAIKAVYVEQVPMQMIGARLGVRDAGLALDQAHPAVAKRLR
jgi:hypothetical protein